MPVVVREVAEELFRNQGLALRKMRVRYKYFNVSVGMTLKGTVAVD